MLMEPRHERIIDDIFKCSLNGEIRPLNNISESGVSITTSEKFEVESMHKMTLFVDDQILHEAVGKVIRCHEHGDDFVYGISYQPNLPFDFLKSLVKLNSITTKIEYSMTKYSEVDSKFRSIMYELKELLTLYKKDMTEVNLIVFQLLN